MEKRTILKILKEDFYNSAELMLGLGLGVLSAGLASLGVLTFFSSLSSHPKLSILGATLSLGAFCIYRAFKLSKKCQAKFPRR